MSKLIAVKIDVTKIDKSKLFKGQKGTYANFTMDLKDNPDNYGNDCSIWLEQSKEERQQKADRVFLGSGKVVWSDSNDNRVSQHDDTPPSPYGLPLDDKLPF
jgi:hypothetical protein